MASKAGDNDSLDTQKFVELQESLLRVPSSPDLVCASASSRPNNATDAIILADRQPQPNSPSRISGSNVDFTAPTVHHPALIAPDEPLPSLRLNTLPNYQSRPHAVTSPRQLQPGTGTGNSRPVVMQPSGSNGEQHQSSGVNDTQLLPDHVYDDYRRSIIHNAASTRVDEDVPHINLVDSEYNSAEEPLAIEDDSADELGVETTQARTEAVTSPTSFSPITPALAGNKRDIRGRIVTPASRTPALDLSGLFQSQAKKNVMGLSQIFNQTQATSSPLPGPYRSDPVFERPSPDLNLRLQTSPSGRPSSSKTVREMVDPRGTYVSVKESQELRERRKHIGGRKPFMSSPGMASDDDEADLDAEMRRIHWHKRTPGTDKGLKRVAATAGGPTSAKRRRPFKTSETVIGLYTPRNEKQGVDVQDVVSDDVQAGNDEEANSDAESHDQYDELSQAVISSERNRTPKTPQALEVFGASRNHPLKQPGGSEDAIENTAFKAIQRNGTQPSAMSPIVRVADSQPQKWSRKVPPRPQSPSSCDSRQVLSLSQDASLSSNTRTQLQATPPNKGIVDTSSIPPAPAMTSQLREDQSESPEPDVEVTSSPPVVRRDQPEDQDQASLHDGYIETGLEPDDEDELQPPRNTNTRLTYTIPGTSPDSSAVNHGPAGGKNTPLLRNQRRVLRSGRIDVSNEQSTEQSNGTTPFETARSNLSEGKQASTASTKQNPNDEAPIHSFHRMTDILNDPTPEDSNIMIPISEIDVFNQSDEDFQQVINRSGSDVRKSARKRNIQDRALKEPAKQLNASHTESSDKPAEQRQSRLQKTTPGDFDAVSGNLRNSSKESSNSQKGRQTPSLRKGQRTIAETPQTAGQNPLVRAEASVERIRNRPHRSRTDVDPIQSTVLAETASLSIVPPLNNPLVTRRVFARFRGSTILYPGTCLGLANPRGTEVKVKFEDGTEDTVNPTQVRRLELRAGDRVKVDLPNYRKSTYVVRGLKDLITSEDLSSQNYPQTDMFGNHNVILVEKPRASLPVSEDAETIEAPIKSLYITGTMWPQYNDREYVHVPSPTEPSTRMQTPTEMPEVKTPPSSRQRTRRLKTEMRLEEIGFLAPGIFSNMAFAISYTNEVVRQTISAAVSANGGLILDDGFDQLLTLSGESAIKAKSNEESVNKGLSLSKIGMSVGFTALITDSHNRRPKYLQALAIDLPCLSGHWISDSVEKGKALPYARYLLAAGESSYLDGAVRSRTLSILADPAVSSFKTTFDKRPRLLNGQNIIFVPGKKFADKWKVIPSLFLMMGAQKVRRATGIADVKTILTEDRNDWNYVFVEDKSLDNAKTELNNLGDGFDARESRRRRASGRSRAKEGAVEDVKVVSDEFVIQSLILGELHVE